jgi:hypothetical protein
MSREQIIEILAANIDKWVQVTFDDGHVESITVQSVDDEGFLHSGPDGINPGFYWSIFDEVTAVRGM